MELLITWINITGDRRLLSRYQRLVFRHIGNYDKLCAVRILEEDVAEVARNAAGQLGGWPGARLHVGWGYQQNNRLLFGISARGGAHPITRRELSLQGILSDAVHGVPRGGTPGAVSWSLHATRSPNSKHGHHDDHVWGHGLPTQPVRNCFLL